MSKVKTSEVYLQKMEATRARFLDGLPSRLDAVVAQLAHEKDHDAEESALHKLHRLLHELVGNASMLDLTDLAANFRQVLTTVEAADQEKRILSTHEQAEILDAVAGARPLAEMYFSGNLGQ